MFLPQHRASALEQELAHHDREAEYLRYRYGLGWTLEPIFAFLRLGCVECCDVLTVIEVHFFSVFKIGNDEAGRGVQEAGASPGRTWLGEPGPER